MYHRFNQPEYPSTNIQMEEFKKHMEIIKKSNYDFYNPITIKNIFNTPQKKKKILLTIDDAFLSFYKEAWPYLKKNKIPFILFVSTEPVGKNGYMTWEQIKEIDAEPFSFIGHHSHTHQYLIDKTNNDFISDVEKANKIFLEKLNYIPSLYSYTFGEYSKFMKDHISKNFDFAFGQHSGVIDITKDKFELPRFPINENYGQIERFVSIINSYPLQYKSLFPEEKKLTKLNNPPEFKVEFFKEQKNIKNINCYSNEGGNWEKSKIEISSNTLNIKFTKPFILRTGRINCTLNEDDKLKWFGTQFIILEN
ncbi:MAG: polysaccharide deacetylase [Pelagibacteraceae bacterium]|nr:polysaccharide deacetylase [Pelagibacteraceae bacterium]